MTEEIISPFSIIHGQHPERQDIIGFLDKLGIQVRQNAPKWSSE